MREPSPASEVAWVRFVRLYTPLLFHYARRAGAAEQDAPDLVQDVFLVLAREMRSFQHDPGRRFRGWLWIVLRNKWRDRIRQQAAQPLAASGDTLDPVASPDNVEELGEEEYRAYLFTRALELMQAELPAGEWQVWQEYIVQGRQAARVAEQLGLSVNQVYITRSRLLCRIRAELEGLLD